MNTTLTPIITEAGLDAIFNADNNGLNATITEIALGDSGWMPDETATALQNEIHRIPVSGERINASQIHLTGVEDDASLEYWVREVGFYLADGTLLAIWSSDTQALAYKAAGVDLLLAFDLVLSALPAESVTVDGSGGFSLSPATDSKPGLIRIATHAEVDAGTATDVAINPAQLNNLIVESNSISKIPDRQYFTTSGSFIVPENVTKIRVTVAGAGGGGGGIAGAGTKGGEGGTSSFGSKISAVGGEGGFDADTTSITGGAAHGTASGGDINIIGGGSPGGLGAREFENNYSTSNGQAGAYGGLAVADMSVTPDQSYSVIIGAGGLDNGSGSTPGSDGYIFVEY